LKRFIELVFERHKEAAFETKYTAAWKTAFDRLFYNTHQRTFEGKQIGFIISGPFKKLPDFMVRPYKHHFAGEGK